MTARSKKRRFGIQGKLFAALAVVSATTVAAGAVAYVGFLQVSETTRNIVDQQSPIMTTALELRADSGELVAAAPAFIAARSQEDLATATNNLEHEQQQVYQQLDRLEGLGLDEARVATLRGQVQQQVESLRRLRSEVGERNSIETDLEARVESLRRHQTALSETLAERVEAARSDLVEAGRKAAVETRQTIEELLANEFTRLRLALTVNTDVKQAAVLLMRGAYSDDIEALEQMQADFQATVDHLKPRLEELKGKASLGILPILMTSSLEFGTGSDSLFKVRQQYLEKEDRDATAKRIFDSQRDRMIRDVQGTLDDADRTLSEVVEKASQSLRENAQSAMARNADTIDRLVQQDLEIVTTLLELRAEISGMIGLMTTGATVQVPDQLEPLIARFETRLANAEGLMGGLAATHVEPLQADFDGLKALGTGEASVFALRREALAARAAADSALIASRDIAEALAQGVSGLVTDARSGMADAAANSRHALARSEALLAGIIGASLLVSLAIAFGYVRRGVTRPLMEKTQAMHALANEDLEVDIRGTQRSDEIGDMARALAFFKDSLIRNQELVEEQRREGERKLTQSRAITEAASGFEHEAMAAVQRVRDQSANIRDTVGHSGSAIQQAATHSFEVAEAAERTEANVSAVSHSVSELLGSSQEIGQRVEDSTRVASTAVDQVSTTNEKIQGLAQAADKIGEVVSLIQDIAEQTNLLALNATIEAARAGDAGKGFAVVAGEVKNLASQTSKATEDITTQIHGIQDATKDAVKSMEVIHNTIRDIDNIAGSVASAVEQQNAATAQISENTRILSQDAETVRAHVGSMIRNGAQSAAQSVTMVWAAEDIDETIGLMDTTVSRFIAAVTENTGADDQAGEGQAGEGQAGEGQAGEGQGGEGHGGDPADPPELEDGLETHATRDDLAETG